MLEDAAFNGQCCLRIKEIFIGDVVVIILKYNFGECKRTVSK